MLQQVSPLAPSAPQHRGLVAGEALGAAVGGQPAGDDFLALLAQAEGRDGVPLAGDVVPEGSAADQGAAGLPAGLATGLSPAMSAPARQDEAPGTTRQDGDDASDGIVLAGDMKGNGEAGLVAGVVTDLANAASPPSMIALQGAVGALPVSTEGFAQPATGAARSAPARQDGASGTTSQDGDNASDGIVLAGDMKGNGEAGLVAGVATDPAHAVSPPPMIALQGAVGALSVSTEGFAQPATGAAQSVPPPPALLPQDEVPPLHLPAVAPGLAAVGREAAPAARTALVAKGPPDNMAGGEQPAVTSASELDSFAPAQVASQDLAEGSELASAVRAESGPAYPTGSAPSLMVSSSLPEGRGLSMPADPSIAGVGSLPGYPAPGLSSPPAGTSFALPYQRLLHPQLSAQVAPAVLSMGVVPGADGGPGRLTVAIRPAELGTLQIITERTEDGTARIAVLAERPETLQLLVRDAPTLENALRAAGVDEGGGLSLTFGLANQGTGDGAGDARRDASHVPGRGDDADPRPDIIGSAHATARTSLLDLSL